MSEQDRATHLSNKKNDSFSFLSDAHSIAMISAITQAHLDKIDNSKSTDSSIILHDAGNSFGGRDEASSKKNKHSN